MAPLCDGGGILEALQALWQPPTRHRNKGRDQRLLGGRRQIRVGGESRHTEVAKLPRETHEILGEQVTYMAQLELCRVFPAVTVFEDDFRDK